MSTNPPTPARAGTPPTPPRSHHLVIDPDGVRRCQCCGIAAGELNLDPNRAVAPTPAAPAEPEGIEHCSDCGWPLEDHLLSASENCKIKPEAMGRSAPSPAASADAELEQKYGPAREGVTTGPRPASADVIERAREWAVDKCHGGDEYRLQRRELARALLDAEARVTRLADEWAQHSDGLARKLVASEAARARLAAGMQAVVDALGKPHGPIPNREASLDIAWRRIDAAVEALNALIAAEAAAREGMPK
jgi:hypothetical protein